MVRLRLVWFALLLGLAVPMSAQTLTFQLDPAKTSVQFTFGATLHTVRGSLRAKEGAVRLDPSTGTATGRILLDATSAQTGNSHRDRKMHEKILESRRFPDIVFNVERFSGSLHRTGRSDLELHGTLEMHGTRRPIGLPATATVNGDQVVASAVLLVPYMDWGLPDPSFFVLRVAKEVRVEIKAYGRLSD
jgi:polyisoprenoid-binding protein YceI